MPRKPRDDAAPTLSQSPAKIKINDLIDIAPLSENQKTFFEMYDRDDYFIALHGVAGTGKTFCALYKAIKTILTRASGFNKIIVVRSAVQSRDVGHLPGDITDKLNIYQAPYRQICASLFNRKDAWDILVKGGRIEFISTSFIRGMSFDNAIILVDECQNLDWAEIDTVMTRVGSNSKILLCGDYRQTDLNRKKSDLSGLNKFFKIASRMKSFTRVEFTIDDICRSSLVKDYIIARTAYEDEASAELAKAKNPWDK